MTEPRERDLRKEVAEARRVVVKIGSSSLTTPSGGLDPDRLDALVEHLAARRSADVEIVLVSSGAIAAGLSPLGLRSRPGDLATQQAAASVGQGLLMHRYTDAFARRGFRVGQVLLTVEDVIRRSQYRNAYRTFHRLLELGVLPIVNENDTVATHEIRFGDNDRLAALTAHLVRADLLALFSDVEGLYDDDPRKPGARMLTDVVTEQDLAAVRVGRNGSAVGTGGMATKVDAAGIASRSGIPAIVTSADLMSVALRGEPVGTLFHPTGPRRPTRLLWLAHASTPAGRLRIDDGAVVALRERRASLLPAGITAVEGEFAAGDPVELVASDGSAVARGLVNFDAEQLPRLLGRSTRELASELGEAYQREVVHSDDLALL